MKNKIKKNLLCFSILIILIIFLFFFKSTIFNNKINKKFNHNKIVPKNIFQTHENINIINNDKKLKNAQNSWKKNKDYNYYFYNNNDRDNFMKLEFPNIYSIFKNLPYPVMKADLWRYCIIYKYGGIYADADTFCKVSPDIFIKNSLIVIVPEFDVGSMCQWVFSAPKESPIIKEIINETINSLNKIENLKSIKTEKQIYELTGPTVFTKGINNWLLKKNLPILESYNRKNYRNKIIYLFDNNDFHINKVIHYYYGFKGWKKDVKNSMDLI